jgi:hypothetical protein
MATWTDSSHDPQADLEKLAAELDDQKYAVSLITSGGSRPHLHVTNRDSPDWFTENIYAAEGWFWWGWVERIAPVGDLAKVVAAIAQVLRAVDARR